jgi:hypothetical protein
MYCEHPGCHCRTQSIVREGRRYCSEECADMGESAGRMPCNCGHPGCK